MKLLRRVVFLSAFLPVVACNNDVFIDTFTDPAESSFTVPGSGGTHTFMLPADNMTMALYVESGEYDVDAVMPDGTVKTNSNWLEHDGRLVVSHPRVDMTVERYGRRVDVTVARYYSKRDERVELVFSTEYQSFTDTLKIPAYNPYVLKAIDYRFSGVTGQDDAGTTMALFEGNVNNPGDTEMKFPFTWDNVMIPAMFKCVVVSSADLYFDMVCGTEIPVPGSLDPDPSLWQWGLLGDTAVLGRNGIALLKHYPPLPSVAPIPAHTKSYVKLSAETKVMSFPASLTICNDHTGEMHEAFMWLKMEMPFEYEILRYDTANE
ncbi:hypothetical protein [uncultured Muribaculum sp.]|uniref:hypothetical protein n=1 Tax=uncultured Muribaculum sp. TaxID=1918613 RepID=UPI0025E7A095|nr:hypothetical protein [uncultured Muribaculum sp.]